jgi:type IV secretion system protein VirB10
MNTMKIPSIIFCVILVATVSQAFHGVAQVIPPASGEVSRQGEDSQVSTGLSQSQPLPPGPGGNIGLYAEGNGTKASGVLSPPAVAGSGQAQALEEVDFEMAVPEGTVIPIVLTAFLNTQSSQVGDILYADTTYPIWIQQRLVIPKGSTVRGTVTSVVRPGKIKGKGHLAVRFDDILLPNGVKRELVAGFRGIHGPGDESLDRKSETVSSGSSKGTDAGTVIGTSSTGAIIGVIADNGTGAAIGAAAGAAVGLATVLFTRGRDLVLSPGTQFDLELKKPLKFAFNELDFTGYQLNSAQRDVRPRTFNPNPRNTDRRMVPLPGIGFPFPRIF